VTRILVHKLEKELGEKTIRLIAGIDTAPENRPNAIFYIRTETEYQFQKKKMHEEFWLSLKELEQLGMLLLISSKFWGETLRSGSRYSEEKIMSLKGFWRQLLESWPEPLI